MAEVAIERPAVRKQVNPHGKPRRISPLTIVYLVLVTLGFITSLTLAVIGGLNGSGVAPLDM